AMAAAACNRPPEKIVPYVKAPENLIPGKPLFFASAMPLGGIGTGVLVESHMGRPTKIEGNPDHPNNRPGDFPADDVSRDPRGSSATDIFTQASILGLYDPDRSQPLTYREDIRTWTTFVGELRTAIDEQRSRQGAGLRLLTETVTSPTLAAQIKELLTAFPQAKWHQYEPANADNARVGAMMAFGQPVNINYKFDLAQRVLSLDNDFLSAHPGYLRYARDFMARRRLTDTNRDMNRLYVFESTPTNTGAKADHRWTVGPRGVEAAANALGARVGLKAPVEDTSAAGVAQEVINAIASDLTEHKGSSIVLAGNEASPIVHAIAHAMNDALGNVGKTVFYTDSIEANPADQRQSLQDLVNDLDGGKVDLLVMLGGNPVYTTPADLKFTFERLQKAKLRVHLSQYNDETSELCHWHIPEAHYLESWSDARAYDGTVTIVQPLIEPLYGGKTAHELLTVFSDQYDRKAYDIVRQYWQTARTGGSQQTQQKTATAGAPQAQQSPNPASGASPGTAQPAAAAAASPDGEFESWWRQALHDGFIPNTALPNKTVSFNSGWAANAQTSNPSTGGFDIVFRPDPSIYDGRFANNGWLQELPKPLTKITWDNAALVSPNTARKLGLETNIGRKGGDVYVDTLRITHRGQTIGDAVPAWIMPGQPDNVITLHLGYGRKRTGRVGNNYGYDAYSIRTSDAPWAGYGVQVEKGAGKQYDLACSQLHFLMEDPNFSKEQRDIVRVDTLAEYLQANPNEEPEHPTLYPEYDYKNQGVNTPNYAWGMAIDLNNCVGCNACTVACQSENNIPIVGKSQVERSREMHWIRIDTYFKGADPNTPEGTNFMPVPCMHCEKAPCEPVCPVHATVHSAEGLNDMVYNRCVGTRYCSNNCPYKVRRFNFFLYQDWETPTYQLMRNPDVSVRSRGVMEKCTYCVQRIQGAKIQSEVEGRRVRDGEIVTACQAVCPTEAIVFGDVNDPNSRVSKVKANKRNYSLLDDLNTQPRTTYLSDLRNPNPDIK
ncbi:MAG: 4Fe-4S dicluster domain-containing protein, partial [Pyrinomonadaceae bacterium]